MMGKKQNLTKKRWLILIASCMINLCIGSLYAWSVFAAPMAQYLSTVTGTTLTSGDLSLVFVIANSVGPVTMIFGGSINDKIGPRWVVFLGGLLFGLGMLLAGFVGSVKMLVITFGLGCGLGMGLVYGCTVNNSVKFFPDKRGLISGIAVGTYGFSSVIIPPVASVLLNSFGVQWTFRLIGGAFLLIICSMAFLLEKCPDKFVPDGYVPPENVGQGAESSAGKDWKGMLKDPIFYIMISSLTCGAFSGLMITSQASPIAQFTVGVSESLVTAAVCALALFNAAGRIAAGFVSDKIGRIKTLMLVFLLSIVGQTLLYFTGEGQFLLFMAAITVIGICFGALMGVYPAFTTEQFGTKNNSVNYGVMFIGFALAGLLGPTCVGKVFASTGSYHIAYLIAIGLAAAGFILIVVYKNIPENLVRLSTTGCGVKSNNKKINKKK